MIQTGNKQVIDEIFTEGKDGLLEVKQKGDPNQKSGRTLQLTAKPEQDIENLTSLNVELPEQMTHNQSVLIIEDRTNKDQQLPNIRGSIEFDKKVR